MFGNSKKSTQYWRTTLPEAIERKFGFKYNLEADVRAAGDELNPKVWLFKRLRQITGKNRSILSLISGVAFTSLAESTFQEDPSFFECECPFDMTDLRR